MVGFLAGPGTEYDRSRDASQRRMLHEAEACGANVFEVFSNSAPWWVAGGRSEASFGSFPKQGAVITTSVRALAGTGAVVSGTEANSMDAMTGFLAQMGAASLNPPGKPLWAREVGCFSAG